ncbi:MAG: tRNA pseudouridine(38-40) synthase TruA [Victivallaceae bacterium]|nr:tRNA pseudouridine(38-40) synthase TruA [Victivallaceae bacterium]
MAIENTPFVPFKRYRVVIAYDGTAYSGWQIQKHSLAIQEVIQKKLTNLYDRQEIHLVGCSRTDRGVHAQGFVASFLVPERPDIPPEKLMKAVNHQMPPEIKIRAIEEAPLDFNARFDTLGKAYTYVINNGPESPFLDRYAWHPIHRMDPEKIRAAAAMLTGTHDFSSFVVERREIDDAVRTIYRIEVQEFFPLIAVTFVGNGFLYKMIRCLMGTLEWAGAGKLSPADVKKILEAKNRLAAPETAPPNGLFLMRVFYDEASLQNFHLTQLPFLEIGAP